MARYRTKPINAFLQELMDERGWKTLQDASDATGLSVAELSRFADFRKNPVLRAHLRAAEKLEVPIDRWIKGMLSETA
jgi:hypothetical protein